MARDQHGFAVQTCNSRAIHMEQMNRPPGSGGFARRLPGRCARQDSASHNQCKDRRNRKSAHPRVRRLSHRGSSNATGPEPTGLAQCGRSLACFVAPAILPKYHIPFPEPGIRQELWGRLATCCGLVTRPAPVDNRRAGYHPAPQPGAYSLFCLPRITISCAIDFAGVLWSHPPGSNRRPAVYETAALPTELGWPSEVN